MTDRPRALAVLIAVFLLGSVLGIGGSYYWLKKQTTAWPAGFARNFPPMPPRSAGGRPRFTDMLDLTPDQERKFREIMADSRNQLEALRIEQVPKLEAIRDETNRRLMSILNDEQKAKFEEIRKGMEFRGGDRRPPYGGRGMPRMD